MKVNVARTIARQVRSYAGIDLDSLKTLPQSVLIEVKQILSEECYGLRARLERSEDAIEEINQIKQ